MSSEKNPSSIWCIIGITRCIETARRVKQMGGRKEKGAKLTDAELDNLCVNTIRFLAVDAVQKANSGHPGAPMGSAPMTYVLWDRFLKHNPADSSWPDRD